MFTLGPKGKGNGHALTCSLQGTPELRTKPYGRGHLRPQSVVTGSPLTKRGYGVKPNIYGAGTCTWPTGEGECVLPDSHPNNDNLAAQSPDKLAFILMKQSLLSSPIACLQKWRMAPGSGKRDTKRSKRI